MAGYSGTPLPKKLGIKEQFRVAMFDLPADVKSELKASLASCDLATDGPLDFAMIFVKAAAELKKQFPRFAKQLAPAGILWVSWPRKPLAWQPISLRTKYEKIGLDAGLVDVKVCAVNEDLVRAEIRDPVEGSGGQNSVILSGVDGPLRRRAHEKNRKAFSRRCSSFSWETSCSCNAGNWLARGPSTALPSLRDQQLRSG